MTRPLGGDAGWATRVAKAGVRLDLWDTDLADDQFALLAYTILRAARESTLSDADLYPLLALYWIGRTPTVGWPPQAPALARRCAANLATHARCELEEWMCAPTDGSMLAAHNAIIDELHLAPRDLLVALSDHWEQLSCLEMPIDADCTLLTFAQHVLLEPVVAACALLWSTLESPPASPSPAPAIVWGDNWSPVDRDDWSTVAAAELDRLGRPDRVPRDADEADMFLAAARAADLAGTGDPTRIAVSIVRTSGWPGDTALIDPLAERAVGLAQRQRDDIDPETDNDEIVDEIQSELTPPAPVLMEWLRDPSFGALRDHAGSSRTGAEMLQAAAEWLTWSLARAALEVFVAMRSASSSDA